MSNTGLYWVNVMVWRLFVTLCLILSELKRINKLLVPSEINRKGKIF